MFLGKRNSIVLFLSCVDICATSCVQGAQIDLPKIRANKTKAKEALNPFKPGSPYFCPEKAEYSFETHFCVRDGKALGPFTKKMVELCKSEAPAGVACEAPQWPVQLAGRLRGDDACPKGASQLENGFCAEGENVYGPFALERVDVCKKENGGPDSESNRWSIFFAETTRKVPEPVVIPPASNEENFDRYIAPTVYQILREDKGKGYGNNSNAQHSRDLFYNGTKGILL